MSHKKMVVPLVGAPGVKLTGTTLKQNLTDADIQAASIIKLYDRFKPDAMLPFMDLTVEAEALGLQIHFPENDNPSVREHPVKEQADFENIINNWNGLAGRMPLFIDVVKKMSQILPSSVKKYAYVIGPITLAGELMGVSEVSVATIEQPEFVSEILDFSVKVISEYSIALFDAGADAVVVLEPTAMLLSPRSSKKNSFLPFKRILENVKNKPLILHICGKTTHLVKGMCETGAVGLSLDTPMDFPELAKIVPDNIDLIGNVDPTKVFLDGTPEDVERETIEFLKSMEGVKNFILSSGCDLPLGTPLENIDAFMRAGNRWKNNQELNLEKSQNKYS
jgi:uroporphyrinogen decarboxylase